MKPTLHIYTTAGQPATNYLDRHNAGRPLRFRNPPRRVFCCENCRRRRWAMNMSVQVYYDSIRFFCTDRTGCKSKRRKR